MDILSFIIGIGGNLIAEVISWLWRLFYEFYKSIPTKNCSCQFSIETPPDEQISKIYEELIEDYTTESLYVTLAKVEAIKSSHPNNPEIIHLERQIKAAIANTPKSHFNSYLTITFVLFSLLLFLIQQRRARRPRRRLRSGRLPVVLPSYS